MIRLQPSVTKSPTKDSSPSAADQSVKSAPSVVKRIPNRFTKHAGNDRQALQAWLEHSFDQVLLHGNPDVLNRALGYVQGVKEIDTKRVISYIISRVKCLDYEVTKKGSVLFKLKRKVPREVLPKGEMWSEHVTKFHLKSLREKSRRKVKTGDLSKVDVAKYMLGKPIEASLDQQIQEYLRKNPSSQELGKFGLPQDKFRHGAYGTGPKELDTARLSDKYR